MSRIELMKAMSSEIIINCSCFFYNYGELGTRYIEQQRSRFSFYGNCKDLLKISRKKIGKLCFLFCLPKALQQLWM